MNDPSQMMPRSFGIWPPAAAPPAAADGPMPFQAPPLGPFPGGGKPGRVNWKGKKAADKRKKAAAAAAAAGGAPAAYRPPTLNELQHQNRMKARRFYPKKKFARFAAPRNTTSYIIRAKKCGGIASLVSPCPVTPAILPTPKFSPSREGLVDMAKEEWGVDGYGSMKGLIRLRSETGMEMVPGGGEEEEMEDEGSSESDVEEHLEVERRLDHDLSRFEMVYPNYGEDHGAAAVYALENRVDDQDTHIAQLEEENLTLKERLFLVEQEMGDLRRRLLALEARDANNHNDNNNGDGHGDDNHSNSNNNDGIDMAGNEEASEENEGGGDVCSEKSAGDCEESNEAEAGTLMRE